jgi:pimeloyl-ACP methyl ester carboxylesterase
MTPRDHFIDANRLRHHLLEWGKTRPETAPKTAPTTGPTVLLLHGFLEHAHAWDFVAPRLADAGFRVLALDWRGHGDTQWVGAGGYYHFPDYAADLAGIVRALGGRTALVGHSMGAGGAVLYAGTAPATVTALACIDALGPPDMRAEDVPRRYESWFADLDKTTTRERSTLTLAEATARIRERFPRFSDAVASHLALHGTREAERPSEHGAAGAARTGANRGYAGAYPHQRENGARAWKFDPLHQTTAPTPYYVAQARPFWRRITCPVLYVAGSDSPYRLTPEDEADRLAALRAEHVVLPGVAHHPHLEAPERLTEILITFLRRSPCAD